MDGPLSEDYEDRRHAESRAGQKRESCYIMDSYAEGCLKGNSSTQQTDFGLRVLKTDENFESHVEVKTSLKGMTHGYTGEHHWEK